MQLQRLEPQGRSSWGDGRDAGQGWALSLFTSQAAPELTARDERKDRTPEPPLLGTRAALPPQPRGGWGASWSPVTLHGSPHLGKGSAGNRRVNRLSSTMSVLDTHIVLPFTPKYLNVILN